MDTTEVPAPYANPPMDLIDLMTNRLRTADITDDEFEVGVLLAMNAQWISQSGTKASGRFPGVSELARQADMGPYRVLAALEGLVKTDRLARVRTGELEEYWLTPLAPRWERWTQLNPLTPQAENPTYFPHLTANPLRSPDPGNARGWLWMGPGGLS